MPIIRNEAFRLLVAALHRGDVPQAQHPGLQSGEDDAVRHFLLGRHGIGHVDRGIGVVGMERAARGIERRALVLEHQAGWVHAIRRQPLHIQGDGDFLVLRTVNGDAGQGRDLLQAGREIPGIIQHLPISLVLGFHRDEQRGDLAEIVQHHDGQHTGGQGQLGGLEAEFDLGPDFILGPDRRGQVHQQIADPILGRRLERGAVHFLAGEQDVLQRFGHLVAHLLRRGAWVNGRDHTLLDLEGREFVPIHPEKAYHADHKQERHKKVDDLPVANGVPDHPAADFW